MNNFILLLINALSVVGVFTKQEAEELWDEMRYATLPDSFEGSYQLIEKIFAKVEIDKKVSTNLDEKVLDLETRLKALETAKKVIVTPSVKPVKETPKEIVDIAK